MKIQLLIGMILFPGLVLADENSAIDQLQRSWAHVNYELTGKEQLQAFEELLVSAEQETSANSDSAPLWVWSGIIKSTYAGAKGGLGALGLAKDAKRDLEKAIAIDGNTLQGSAYASLGTLYFNVPGWPVGFGDDDKAEELLLRALALNSQSIDNNYFYASYLIEAKRYAEARDYLQRAQNAPARPNRPLADSGRHQEISKALMEIRDKH